MNIDDEYLEDDFDEEFEELEEQIPELSTKEILEEKKESFIKDLIKIYRNHGLSLAHEDHQGAFIVRNLEDDDIEWLKDAFNEIK